MKNVITQSIQCGIKLLVLIQMVTVSVLTIFMAFWGIKAFYSSLLGGTICILGNILLASGFFISGKITNSKKFLHSIYMSETIKFVLTILFFVAFIKYLHIQALPFFLSYIITQNVFWFSPFLFK